MRLVRTLTITASLLALLAVLASTATAQNSEYTDQATGLGGHPRVMRPSSEE